jgi:hypothetical protein
MMVSDPAEILNSSGVKHGSDAFGTRGSADAFITGSAHQQSW